MTTIKFIIKNNKIYIKGQIPEIFKREIPSLKEEKAGIYTCPFLPYSSFVSFAFIKRNNIEIDDEILKNLREMAKELTFPRAYIQQEGRLHFNIPSIYSYTKLMESIGATHDRLTIYSVRQSRLYESIRTMINWKHPFLPKVLFDETLKDYLNIPLTDIIDLESLMEIDFKELYTIKYAWQLKEQGFEKLKLRNIADLVLRRPTRYEDRKNISKFYNYPFGKPSYFRGQLIEFLPMGLSNTITYFTIKDENGFLITCQIYGGYYLRQLYRPGQILFVYGSKIGRDKLSVNKIFSQEEVDALPIAPIYKASPSNKITSQVLLNSIYETLERFKGDDLFNYINPIKNLSFWEAVKVLHFPSNIEDYLDAIDTLAFYELVALQLCFLENKGKGKVLGTSKIKKNNGYLEEVFKKLPFTLTEGQIKAIQDIIKKMNKEEAMDVLLSADVGSGKTICAILLALHTVDNGEQVSVIAPTEVLAKQLFDAFSKIIQLLEKKPSISFLSSSLKNKEQNIIKAGVKLGETDIIIGTHSLFNIDYNNLGFVIIDEQQKFGANQREKLKFFGRRDGKFPDILNQTATPIPQSTAKAFYGDIDLVTIEEKPKGRKEIQTKWFEENSKDFLKTIVHPIWSKITEEIEKNNQIFIIAPAVDEEVEKSVSVLQVEKILKNKFPNEVKSIHGKLAKNKQNEIIDSFKKKEFHILIGSSILEVGIDIKDATLVVVLDADRFGASSLHQIRGRVGRNNKESFCYLIANDTTKGGTKRLNALEESSNGFDIALVDLETRKEGDILGSQQSGESILRFCNLTNHSVLIEEARLEAERLYKSSLRVQALKDSRLLLKGWE